MTSPEVMKAASKIRQEVNESDLWQVHVEKLIDAAADEKYKPLVDEVLQAINGEFEPELMWRVLVRVKGETK
jgi:hypothetical protein